ncbi:hypothetical protein SAMN02745117_00865 [Lampropedia hyalina DSM 16112]|jgi:hypothetical protein|uniref:Uncharacterized protein n=2 Tax=Lampropedia TaxID=198705 RepID=A0A1M4WHX5_9BURK|nr:hypothetical protein SAMN02745117_00865 [Lampropedia hyalina DSM 16112]
MGHTEVGSLDELREHMTAQILEYIDNGLLEYWLQSIQKSEIFHFISTLNHPEAASRLVAVSNYFNLKINLDIAEKSLNNYTTPIKEIENILNNDAIEMEIIEIQSKIDKNIKEIELEFNKKSSENYLLKCNHDLLKHRIKFIIIISKNEFNQDNENYLGTLIQELLPSKNQSNEKFIDSIIQILKNPNESYHDSLNRFPELHFGETE